MLWGTAGGTCSICNKPLCTEASNNGKIHGEHAHIYGLKHTDNRYDSNLSDEFVNSFENHILVCCDCHTTIDKKPLLPIHSAENLKIFKKRHIDDVALHLGYGINSISFNELEIITRYIVGSSQCNQELILIKPQEKIDKNKLSSQVSVYIMQGLIQRNLVAQYLQKNPNVNFANKLRNGLVEKYNELVNSGYAADFLFHELWSYASRGSYESNIRAAGLTVISYFFEICDIFEK